MLVYISINAIPRKSLLIKLSSASKISMFVSQMYVSAFIANELLPTAVHFLWNFDVFWCDLLVIFLFVQYTRHYYCTINFIGVIFMF